MAHILEQGVFNEQRPLQGLALLVAFLLFLLSFTTLPNWA